MFYFIGGVARSGKTRLTSLLQKKTSASVLHIDTLIMMLRENIPEYDIAKGIGKRKKRDRIKPLLLSYLRHQKTNSYDIIIEGDTLFPVDIQDYASIVGLENCKSIFLGYPSLSTEQKLANIKEYAQNHYCWIVEKLNPEEQQETVGKLIYKSSILQDEAKKYNQTFINISDDYNSKLNNAVKILTELSK